MGLMPALYLMALDCRGLVGWKSFSNLHAAVFYSRSEAVARLLVHAMHNRSMQACFRSNSQIIIAVIVDDRRIIAEPEVLISHMR
jgi:hypothetical protein